MFGALRAVSGPAAEALRALAADFTPRFELCGPDEVVLDLAGLDRLFGTLHAVGESVRAAAADRRLAVGVAVASTCTAARLLARAADPGTPPHIVERGGDAAALAPLPLALLGGLAAEPDLLPTFRRWGLRTLGDLAALPASAVSARVGARGVAWQRLARGEDARPLRAEVPPERFDESLDLEWPIEGLEPLSFVLGRLLEPLAARLARRGRGAAVLHVRLHLITRAVHERSLQLPAPLCDARTFRTLLLLDLDSHPPPAAIDRVVVAVDPTPARVLQFSLLTRPLPSPEQLSTLLARLSALMGADRCGAPAAPDTWRPGACAVRPFHPAAGLDAGSGEPDAPRAPVVALRRFRHPVAARVRLEGGVPTHVRTDRRGLAGGRVEAAAGPWRTSGGWWAGGERDAPWDHDEWDVALADGGTYRVCRDRATDTWFLEGSYD